ncbi:MAG: NAD(+)--rifampin ADP-ribosyltransferase [Ferruginibacter sp.]
MALEEKGEATEAASLFLQAWNEATNDFEKFLAAHFVARYQNNASEKLKWLEAALKFALKINNEAVNSALSSLYSNIAKCYEDLGDSNRAKKNYESAISFKNNITDKGPFYHGTRADLKIGDLLVAGNKSNYKSELTMNHIYFTALANGAGLAAALAKGDTPERVYIIEPTGSFENDPNVTDKKFPGNPTRSYRTEAALKIVGEVKNWVRQTPEQIKIWREKLANAQGEIIN